MAKARAKSTGATLVIVESPSKARTIERYLGAGYMVRACMGHVRDLPESGLGIDLDGGFLPTYEILPGKRKVISELRKAAKEADTVYLATDLDREGEAIAWHLSEALDLSKTKARRVVFNEITKSAIKEAFEHPHDLDLAKVDAQQARRILDRIVGYQLSPLLWKKIAKGLSAGRVQSVAVKLIVDREEEIRAFVPEESWKILAVFATQPDQTAALASAWREFLSKAEDPDAPRTQKERIAWLTEHACVAAELVKLGGESFEGRTVADARRVVEALGFVTQRVEETDWEEYRAHGLKRTRLHGELPASRGPAFTVRDVSTRRTTTRPQPPFTTAALQQQASTQLGFSASRTMRIAQQLYEGVELGARGSVGLITYMRTDSTNLSKDSIAHVRDMIRADFGDRYLPEKPNVYGSAKRAQEAHEAIRPTDASIKPEEIRAALSAEQWKLYDLIWRRFVACQMEPAQWDSTTLLIGADTAQGEAIFKATGRRLAFDGFYRVQGLGSQEDVVLPPLATGQPVSPLQLDPRQQYTSPPPRYSEAALIKSLEAEGIGRPSTYAAIIQTIQDRGYVEQVDRRFHATDKGEIVTEKLVEHFPRIMDVKFTSHMEDELDKIEEEHLDWVRVLHEFYDPFKESLARAETEMQPARSEPSAYTCPKCSQPMAYRWARTGRFLSCTGYPDCNGAYNVDREGKPIIPKVVDLACEKCGKPMLLRRSKMGPFLGCSGYPECSSTVPCDATGQPLRLVTPEEIERPCEECGEGTLRVKRKARREFLGCDKYPTCKHTASLPDGVYLERKRTPLEPAGFNCEKCSRPMVIREGRRGKFLACSGFPRCKNSKPHEKLDEFLQQVAEGKLQATDTQTAEQLKKSNGNGRRAVPKTVPKTAEGKVDFAALGEPPKGFAWTRTGKPVVETWPEGALHCPECGSDMSLKRGRFGPFYSCSNFPKCRCTVNLRGDAKKRAEEELPAPQRPKPIPTDVSCPECGAKMLLREGRSGKFLGCSAFPKCKTTQPMPPGATVEDLVSAPA
ncbi:MAG: type I DNA topoisomerase [Phycisphaerales bacterium]|nr:type I DNA topoisomerase [Phycisphaerales bacterium]